MPDDTTPITDGLFEQLLQQVQTWASRLDHIPVPEADEFTRTAVRQVTKNMRLTVQALRTAAGGDDVPACRVCGCTEERACPGGCSWAPDPQMEELCDRCVGAIVRVTVEDLDTGEREVRGLPAGDCVLVAVDPCTYTVQPLQNGKRRVTVHGVQPSDRAVPSPTAGRCRTVEIDGEQVRVMSHGRPISEEDRAKLGEFVRVLSEYGGEDDGPVCWAPSTPPGARCGLDVDHEGDCHFNIWESS